MKLLGIITAASVCLSMQGPALQITPVVSYGWEDIPSNATNLTAAERAGGAGVLAAVTSVAEGLDGRVYVLDILTCRVVVFTPDGKYQRSFGRSGKGPGEFIRPNRVMIDKRGNVYVYDPSELRVSQFDANGKYIGQVRIDATNVTDAALSDSVLWVTRMRAMPNQAFVRAYNLRTGAIMDSLMQLSETEMKVASGGNAGRAIPDGRGGINFVGPVPVQWRTHAIGAGSRAPTGRSMPAKMYGTSLFPDAGSVAQERAVGTVTVSTASIDGAAMAPGGAMLITYKHLDKPPAKNQPLVYSRWISMWSASGQELAKTRVPADGYSVLAMARNGDVFLRDASDFPQVVRARVTIRK